MAARYLGGHGIRVDTVFGGTVLMSLTVYILNQKSKKYLFVIHSLQNARHI